LLLEELKPSYHWQTIVIGREDVWPVLRRAAELGGNVRTGLEDTMCAPLSHGHLRIDALHGCRVNCPSNPAACLSGLPSLGAINPAA